MLVAAYATSAPSAALDLRLCAIVLVVRRDEQHAIQAFEQTCRFGNEEMRVVNGIEGSAKKREVHEAAIRNQPLAISKALRNHYNASGRNDAPRQFRPCHSLQCIARASTHLLNCHPERRRAAVARRSRRICGSPAVAQAYIPQYTRTADPSSG